MNRFFVDAETDGLYGGFLSIAVLVTDHYGEEADHFYAAVEAPQVRSAWVREHVLPRLAYAEEFVPIMSLPGMRERTITINSFSKNFTMTGWRVGNIIAPDYLVSTIQTINENVVFTAPSVSQRAAIYAIRDRKRIQPPMIEEYKKRVCYAIQRINAIPKMSVMEARGTFYLFVNIKETGLTSVEAADRILKEAHVLTLPGDTFGACGEGYLRLACTVGVDKLKEVFDRIEKMELFR